MLIRLPFSYVMQPFAQLIICSVFRFVKSGRKIKPAIPFVSAYAYFH